MLAPAVGTHTDTNIKPVECLIFMRDVKFAGYFEHMRGRGVRSIADTDLHQITPDAQTKTRFVLIDAVGVTESQKTVSQPLERRLRPEVRHPARRVFQGLHCSAQGSQMSRTTCAG